MKDQIFIETVIMGEDPCPDKNVFATNPGIQPQLTGSANQIKTITGFDNLRSGTSTPIDGPIQSAGGSRRSSRSRIPKTPDWNQIVDSL
jgi:hypothetical protein